ncbi:response regulator [Seleniivibrio woodruffii]|uniref:Response regulator receiver domain-containing protein n=1 Tax=Seleniivibrio woodruffii TaxID=1078050 RepID=A0A4R1K5B0_9BACT|nr:response regulator [Seleniivibrio woodruffii]TCK59358.1 response regulator receiver domain-containing protein [Seleniivibrio woodruffii]TVZ35603.1 two-component system cell cycle sensor histidine kinase/response regulator CckA [Seleniivibrio woodruffii]
MRKRVLLIDDEEYFRSSVKIALKREGIQVTDEQDGTDGMRNIMLSMSTGDLYDLIILDIMMPGLTGIDILEFILQNELDIPVIVVTGYMDYDLRFFCSNIKRIKVMEKPFSHDMLVSEVLSMLSGGANER